MPTGEIASCSACFSEMISGLTRPPAHTARRFSEWLSLADQTYSHQRISRLCSFHKANNYTGLQSESITLFECLSRYFEYTYTVLCLFHDNVSSVGKGKCPRQIQPETDSFYCQTGFLLRRCCHAHITARRIE